MPQAKPRLRKREIAFALALGAIGAGAAALVLDEPEGRYDRDVVEEEGEQERSFALTDFDEVVISGPQEVDIVLGDKFLVNATGSPEALRQVEAVVENGRLEIRPREGAFEGDWSILDDVSFAVSMPAVTRIAIAGSAEISVDRISGDAFEGVIGGRGTLSIGTLDVDAATFMVNGAGDLDASGRADHVTANISGSGEIHASGLTSQTATVVIGGSGEVDLTAIDEAAVSITGSGDVDISGPAVCSVTRMGGGDVRCEGGGGDEDRRGDD